MRRRERITAVHAMKAYGAAGYTCNHSIPQHWLDVLVSILLQAMAALLPKQEPSVHTE
jgi:alkylation response protein AidB-like acyl-CoA dehydrogenase